MSGDNVLVALGYLDPDLFTGPASSVLAFAWGDMQVP